MQSSLLLILTCGFIEIYGQCSTYNCPPGWLLMPGPRKQCIKIFAEKVTWSFAKHSCHEYGSRLVSVHNTLENSFIMQEVQKVVQGLYGPWMGGITGTPAPGDLNDWFWTDSTEFQTFMNWSPGQPDANTGISCSPRPEACLHMFTNGTWNDACCDVCCNAIGSPNGYVCSLDADQQT